MPSETSAAECLKEILKNGFRIEDIVGYWTPKPANATPAIYMEIDAERKDACRMLESLVNPRVSSPRGLLVRELQWLRKIRDRVVVYKRIARALEEFRQLGMRDADVAAMAGQSPAVICRLRNHLFTVEYSENFLQSVADALDRNLPQSRKIPAEALVRQFKIQVLEFDSQGPITAETRAQVDSAIRAALLRSMGDGAPFFFGPEDLPPHCRAALISIGRDGYLVVLAPGLDTPQQKLALAHEIRHIADRLEAEARAKNDDQLPPPLTEAFQ
jgi:hypothetical protein